MLVAFDPIYTCFMHDENGFLGWGKQHYKEKDAATQEDEGGEDQLKLFFTWPYHLGVV